MNRLALELRRLYELPAPAVVDAEDKEAATRVMIMELTGPDAWIGLSRVWRGVQLELQLPAPAIAVSGSDGQQLWFSLKCPVGVRFAQDFLADLRRHFLADVADHLVRLYPSATEPCLPAPRVPARDETSGNWSAFVAADLAPVFSDTPWLDIEPGAEGQAELLARLQSIEPAALDTAAQRLRPAASSPVSVRSTSSVPDTGLASCPLGSDARDVDPARFLQQVLNNEALDLALRIEAAKALLTQR